MFTLTQNRTAPEELIEFSKNVIQDILMNVRGVNYVMLCSTDGFELAHVYKKMVITRLNLRLSAVQFWLWLLHLCMKFTLKAANQLH